MCPPPWWLGPCSSLWRCSSQSWHSWTLAPAWCGWLHNPRLLLRCWFYTGMRIKFAEHKDSLNFTLSEMAFIEYPQGSKRQSSIFIPGTSLSIPAFWRDINHFILLPVTGSHMYKPLLLNRLSQCCTCRKYSLFQDQDHSSGSQWSGHNHDTPFQSHIFKEHSNKPWWSSL